MISLLQTYTAIGPNLISSFLATGGTAPYVYSVLPGGAGGSINSSTGLYSSPAAVPQNPALQYDTIQVVDNASAISRAKILIAGPLLLLCDILQTQLGLDNEHIYLWDQKIFQPKDFGLYLIVSEENPKVFGNNRTYDADGNAIQTVNIVADVAIDMISRGPAARDQKPQVIAALRSQYAQSQMEANSFYVSGTPISFQNISIIDGPAIPYRYRMVIRMQYTTLITKAVPFFDSFEAPEVSINA